MEKDQRSWSTRRVCMHYGVASYALPIKSFIVCNRACASLCFCTLTFLDPYLLPQSILLEPGLILRYKCDHVASSRLPEMLFESE